MMLARSRPLLCVAFAKGSRHITCNVAEPPCCITDAPGLELLLAFSYSKVIVRTWAMLVLQTWLPTSPACDSEGLILSLSYHSFIQCSPE